MAPPIDVSSGRLSSFLITGQYQYSAMESLRWDIFTGFSRLNGLRDAEASRDTAAEQMRVTI
jgi:hypothetical protein